MSGDAIARILALENLVVQVTARAVASERRLAAAEQAISQLGNGLAGAGGGSGREVFEGTSTTAITGSGGTGTVTLDTGASVTVTNHYTSTVASGKRVVVGRKDDGSYFLIGADC